MAGADDGTPREGEVEITTVETTSTGAGDAAGAPLSAADPLTGGPVEEVVPGIASERERVRTLPDGSVERRLDRVEQPAEVRRRSSPNLVPALLIILALALGAIAAAWWFTVKAFPPEAPLRTTVRSHTFCSSRTFPGQE